MEKGLHLRREVLLALDIYSATCTPSVSRLQMAPQVRTAPGAVSDLDSGDSIWDSGNKD